MVSKTQAETEREMLRNAADETIINVKIDKIKQKLFWYDQPPLDDEIVILVKRWRSLLKKLKNVK